MSVDSVDFPIQEPSPFDLHWYSHKLKDQVFVMKLLFQLQEVTSVGSMGHFLQTNTKIL